MRQLCVVLCFVFALATPSFAVQPDEILPDPKQEQRARALSAELRCLVCQNQSIDDSDAQLARDLRLIVRERIKAGDSDSQIITFLVDRYGEFVLLKPRFGWHTLILWAGPFAILLIGGFVIWRQAQRKALPAVEKPLSPEEQAALQRALGSDNITKM
ncbi:MAG: cytochrome c-type biogenesis protein CcmH [Beijerinckiaceae bacterium]|nr:cytochrome c-type biogenesis protein CcmH [Beijerinckiaceae bacterium]